MAPSGFKCPVIAEEFVRHHGEEGAATYLEMAAAGRELEKELASRLLPNPAAELRQLGSVILGTKAQQPLIDYEYKLLKRLGCEVEYLSHHKVSELQGEAAEFNCGIFFPHDAVINSSEYCRSLLRAAMASGHVFLKENCPRVTNVVEQDGEVIVRLSDGTKFRAKRAVVATGGHFLNDDLNGIVRPCWSYVATVPDTSGGKRPGMPFPHSPNFFTYGFTHDWCMTDGYLRISGEDRTSALKPPRAKSRLQSLAHWAHQKYPYLSRDVTYGELYGVYAETPDYSPLVGRVHPNSNICYILGCNAWGQSILSYGATLIPALLGYASASPAQSKHMNFLSPMRFTLRHPYVNVTSRL